MSYAHEGVYYLCRDCGHICEQADAPNTDAPERDPVCPECGENGLIDPVMEIHTLEDRVYEMRKTVRQQAREIYRDAQF